MVRGITFRMNLNRNEILRGLLRKTVSAKSVIHISEEEIIENNRNNYHFKKSLSRDSMLSILDTAEINVVFLNLQAFPAASRPSQIDDYESFVRSNCEIVLLIIDAIHGELYLKDTSKLPSLVAFLNDCNCTDVVIITDKNDSRRALHV